MRWPMHVRDIHESVELYCQSGKIVHVRGVSVTSVDIKQSVVSNIIRASRTGVPRGNRRRSRCGISNPREVVWRETKVRAEVHAIRVSHLVRECVCVIVDSVLFLLMV